MSGHDLLRRVFRPVDFYKEQRIAEWIEGEGLIEKLDPGDVAF